MASSPLAAPVGAADANARAALLEAVSRRLHADTDDDGLAFPMEAYLVVAYKENAD